MRHGKPVGVFVPWNLSIIRVKQCHVCLLLTRFSVNAVAAAGVPCRRLLSVLGPQLRQGADDIGTAVLRRGPWWRVGWADGQIGCERNGHDIAEPQLTTATCCADDCDHCGWQFEMLPWYAVRATVARIDMLTCASVLGMTSMAWPAAL